jgi:uncharacterized protein YdbL (DUF1318 family)
MLKFMKHTFVSLLFVAVISLPAVAFGLSLDEAKSRGLVGEQISGYLGALGAEPEAQALVQEINSKRRSKYQEIAKQNGTAVSAVELLAGKKAIESSAAGSFVQDPQGVWMQKR